MKSSLYDSIGAFTTVPNTVMKMLPKIGEEAFVLWCYLRYRTNSESGVAFPQYETIKKDTGLNYRKIARSLRFLESLELLTRKKRFGNSTEYVLTCPIPNSGDRTVLTVGTGKSSQRVQTIKNNSIKNDVINCASSAQEGNYQFKEKQPDSEPTAEAKRGIAKALEEFDGCGTRAGIADVSAAQLAQVAMVAEQCNAVLPIQRTRRTAKGLDKAALQIVELNIPPDKQKQFFEYLCNGGGKSLRLNPQANWFLIANSLRTWQARDYPPIHPDTNGKPIQTWDAIPTFKAD